MRLKDKYDQRRNEREIARIRMRESNRRELEAIAKMTPVELADYHERKAFAEMVDNGRGILSPSHYHNKQTSFMLISAFCSLIAAALVVSSLWHLGRIGAFLVCAVSMIGGGVLGNIFVERNFVCDESIEEPLFGRPYRKTSRH